MQDPTPHLDSSVGTVTLRHPRPVRLEGLELFFQRLLWDGAYSDVEGNPAQVLRLKGLARIEDQDRVVIVQGVHDTYDTYESGAECSDCTVVLIGRNLDRDSLQRKLEEMLRTK